MFNTQRLEMKKLKTMRNECIYNTGIFVESERKGISPMHGHVFRQEDT